MKEEYWELFMTSGKIDDYLNYKNSRKADGSSGRKERRESDSIFIKPSVLFVFASEK